MAAAGAAQRPEELTVMVLVAFDDATVRQDDLCLEQVVAGQAVLPARIPSPPPRVRPAIPTEEPAAGGNGQAMLGQLVVEVAEPHAGTYGRHLLRDRNRAHRCDVEDNSVGRGSAGNRVPAAPDRRRQA